jgi:hypothetical protein
MSWVITGSQKVNFDPSYISTALWLDAADAATVTESSGLVSQVNDKSGNGRNFTASGGARPTYSANALNGKAVFTFGGAASLTSASAASTWNFLHNTNGSTVAAVWKAGNSSNPDAFYPLLGTNAGGDGSRTGIVLFYDDRSAVSRNNCISYFVTPTSTSPIFNISANDAITPNAPAILSHIGNPGNVTAAQRSSIRINGGSAIELNTNTGTGSAADASFTLQLGAGGNNAGFLIGYIAELIALPLAADIIIRQKLEGYLAHKWSLTANLPSDHPYKVNPPAP